MLKRSLVLGATVCATLLLSACHEVIIEHGYYDDYPQYSQTPPPPPVAYYYRDGYRDGYYYYHGRRYRHRPEGYNVAPPSPNGAYVRPPHHGSVVAPPSGYGRPYTQGNGTVVAPPSHNRNGTVVAPPSNHGNGTVVAPPSASGNGTVVSPPDERRRHSKRGQDAIDNMNDKFGR